MLQQTTQLLTSILLVIM